MVDPAPILHSLDLLFKILIYQPRCLQVAVGTAEAATAFKVDSLNLLGMLPQTPGIQVLSQVDDLIYRTRKFGVIDMGLGAVQQSRPHRGNHNAVQRRGIR